MKKHKHLSHIRYWGASTSSHQVEGHNTNQWSEWELHNAEKLAKHAKHQYKHWLPVWDDIAKRATDPHNYISGRAVDHYNRYEEDLDIAKKLNMNAFKFSIEWSRIEPIEGEWNQEAIEHYRKYIKAMHKRGLEPILTLWHWTLPLWFDKQGGFEKRSNIKYFVRYAKRLMKELGEDVHYVVTLNEPNSYGFFGYLDGKWPPSVHNPWLYRRVMKNLARTHNRTYKALKKINPGYQIGPGYIFTHYYGSNFVGRIVARFLEYESNEWWMNKIKGNFDVINFQYYFSERVTWFKRSNDNTNMSDYGWKMAPRSIGPVMEKIYRKYKKPIFVTESGVADEKDKYRQWWIEQQIEVLDIAISRGVDIRGYSHWSLLDNFEWSDGYWPKFGLVEVNMKTMKRKIRPSAKAYAKIIKSVHPPITSAKKTSKKPTKKPKTKSKKISVKVKK